MIRIGIPAQDQPDNKFGVNRNYLEFIENFGTPVIILPCKKDEFFDIYSIDALVLPGGSDVDAKRYSLLPKFGVFAPNPFLEHFDNWILPQLVGNIPIFGICRGLQTINVFFGGTLKNLWYHPYSQHETDIAHKISFKGNKEKKYTLGVNSFHHQAIQIMPNNLIVEAESEKDGIIEAISDYDKRIFAVQWHPERLHDNYSINAFWSILK